MKTIIQRISKTTELAIPKRQYDRTRVVSAFGDTVGESDHSWIVQCSHSLNAPADDEQIAEAQRQLGFSIPEEYKRFLRISNGAKLFVVARNRPQGGEPHVRYHLLSCDELVETNLFLRRTFLDAYSDDPEYKGVRNVNYMAFGDATNDNYQAIVVDGPYMGQVFLLFYELQCRPYSEIDSDFYYTIADSLESWFDLIAQTGGWEGRGVQSGSL